jgi:hypothetical protein
MKQRLFLWAVLLSCLMALVLSIGLLIKVWDRLLTVAFALGLFLAALAMVGSLYGILRLWLDLRARSQQLRIERETHAHSQRLEAERYEAEQKRAHELHELEAALARQRFDLEQHLALTRIPYDERGNPPGLVGHVEVTMLPPGNPASAHQIIRGGAKGPEERAHIPLIGPGVTPPSQAVLIGQLPQNSLEVIPGVKASNGEIVRVSIVKVPHFKLIGASGFGKSCLAAALLHQLTETNSPEILQIALLDLEHQTSRLFEQVPHLAEVKVGQRRVSLVATDADEVAIHLGYLRKELDRRARLAQVDLNREPCLMIYVEEMLSLEFEVSEGLIEQYMKDLTVLAVRGRKYGMFLLCCAQVDYSTEGLRIAQKQFRYRGAFAVDPTAARAAGFVNHELVKHNFQYGQPGQFVMEYPAFSELMIAPDYDVKALVEGRGGRQTSVQRVFGGPVESANQGELRLVNAERTPPERVVNSVADAPEHAWQAKVERVRALRAQGWQKIAILEKVWNARRGASRTYQVAEAEYAEIMARFEREAREA